MFVPGVTTVSLTQGKQVHLPPPRQYTQYHPLVALATALTALHPRFSVTVYITVSMYYEYGLICTNRSAIPRA